MRFSYLLSAYQHPIDFSFSAADNTSNEGNTPGPKGMFNNVVSPASKRGASSSYKPGGFVKSVLEFTDRGELVLSGVIVHC